MADMTSVEKALKIITPFKKLQTAWQDEQKALKWMPTRTDFYGRKAEIPIGIAPGGGQSYGFNTSQRQSNRGRKYDNFNVTRTSMYSLLYIDAEAIEASEGGEDTAFLETFKAELEGVNVTNAQETAGDLWGDGTGIWATGITITSPGAGARITLANPEAICRVEVGREIQAVDMTAGPPVVLRNGVPGYMTVTSVRESDGSFTVDNSTFITGLATTDALVFNDCFNKAIKGIRAWIPFTDAELTAAPTLFGMTRTVHPERQAGRRFDGSAFGLSEAIERGIAYGRRGNMKFNDLTWWVNDRYFTAIDLELGAKAYREFTKIGNFGFDTIFVQGDGQKMPIMADQNVPDGFAVGLSRATWCWFTLKGAPRYLTPDGSKSIVKATDDGVEVRWGWRGSPVCLKPSDNMVVKMPAIS